MLARSDHVGDGVLAVTSVARSPEMKGGRPREQSQRGSRRPCRRRSAQGAARRGDVTTSHGAYNPYLPERRGVAESTVGRELDLENSTAPAHPDPREPCHLVRKT